MARYETTGGDIIITIPNCDCGSTGGCDKCQPIVLPKPQNYAPPFVLRRTIPFTYQNFIHQEK